MDSRPVTIYALVDPRTDEVRYVGQTKHSRDRKADHLWVARHKPRHYRDWWIRDVLACGLTPTFRKLEEVGNELRDDAERRWIAHFRSAGARLTNLTGGGDSGLGIAAVEHGWGHPFPAGSAHPLARLTEKDVPEIIRLYQSGQSASAIARTYGVSKLTILKVLGGRSFANVPRPVEPRRDPRTARQLVWRDDPPPFADLTLEQAREMRERFASGESYPTLKAAYGVTTAVVYGVVHGRTYRQADGPVAPFEGRGTRQRTLYLTWDDRTLHLQQWEAITGIGWHTLNYRLKKGWTAEAILTTPVRNRPRV